MSEEFEKIQRAIDQVRTQNQALLSQYGLTIRETGAYEQFGLWSIPIVAGTTLDTPRKVLSYIDELQEQIADLVKLPISLYIEVRNQSFHNASSFIAPAGIPPTTTPGVVSNIIPPAGIVPPSQPR
jgi:hypothetical protein